MRTGERDAWKDFWDILSCLTRLLIAGEHFGEE
jgi:hypothetical protein